MAADRQLSAHFWLREFRGWEQASELEVAQLKQFTLLVLEPTRERWGRIVPTSWRRWSDGTLRTGAHARGAVDFVPLDAPIPVVWAWMADHLAGRFGELIDERDHIHVTPWGVGGTGEVLVEPSEGEFAAVPTAARPWGAVAVPAAVGIGLRDKGIALGVAAGVLWLMARASRPRR